MDTAQLNDVPKTKVDPPSLSEAFSKEFGEQPIEKENLRKSSSAAARLVESHFDELANLGHRRGGFPISLKFSATPRTVSYNDLKEMEKLADGKLGLQHHYSKETIDSMRHNDVGWCKAYGIGGGAFTGGILALAIPALRQRSAAITIGLAALGAVGGYKFGEFVGNRNFDSFEQSSTYLSVEKTKYTEALGGAWKRNTELAAGAGIVAGLAALSFGAPRVAIGLGIAGVATYLGGRVAYQLGRWSAASELEHEADLGRRIEREWFSSY